MAKQIWSKNLIENKEKYGLIWFDLESISRPIDKLRVKAKTLCENQLTEIKTEQCRRNQGAEANCPKISAGFQNLLLEKAFDYCLPPLDFQAFLRPCWVVSAAAGPAARQVAFFNPNPK